MKNHNIFLSQSSGETNDISGKITYTSILESIPANKVNKPIKNWENEYMAEYRWRFMKDKERHIVEISKKIKECDRLYYNKFGEWVKMNIDQDVSQFIVKEYYVYTRS